MDGNEHRERSMSPALVVCGAMLLLPTAYVLSIGPSLVLAGHNYLPVPVFDAIYAPLIWLMYRWDAFHDFLNWYCGLWGWSP